MPRGGTVVVVKRINNNAVLCVDSAGHQVVALGRGLAQATLGSELDLDLVDHTFYDVEPRYVELMRDHDPAYLEVSAQIIDMARSMLTYELSPNIEVALADHIQFAVQRMREHIYLSTPLSYDLQQNYPLEYKIAQWALTRIDHLFEVTLPRNEIAGIAMCIINGAYSSAGAVSSDSAETQDRLLEDITRIVEETMAQRSIARALVLRALPRTSNTSFGALRQETPSQARTRACMPWQPPTIRRHPPV